MGSMMSCMGLGSRLGLGEKQNLVSSGGPAQRQVTLSLAC